MKNNILIIAAHPDDEVLGSAGTILKHVKRGDKVSILIMSDGESSRDSGIDIEKRKKQAKLAAQNLGAELILESLPDNKFDSVPLLDIVKKIETVVNKLQPNIVYTHHSHDLNIDHCLVFKAVLTVCRPQPGYFVRKISCFETPSSTEWQLKNKENIFYPNEYVDITDQIDKKIEILKIYKDELRNYPHPRSEEGVRILAQYRGVQSGFKFAEAFHTIRVLSK